MLELFVVYPSAALAWTAELLRRADDGEQWVTVFRVTVSTREKLHELRAFWPNIAQVELSPVIQ